MRKKVVAVLGALALSFSLMGAAGAENNGQSELAKVKNATAKYHDSKKAIEDGYEEASPLVPNMGIHYVKSSLIDDEVDALTPESLVYEPTKNGLKLVAVEYLSTATASLFGQELDPPHGELPFHTLHVWIWAPNSNGMFAPFNPKVANVEE